MFSRYFVAQGEVQPIPASMDVSTKRKPVLIRFVGLFILCLTMLILSELTIVRIGAIPQPPNIPADYFPGNPLPEHVSCNLFRDKYWLCTLKDASFNFDPTSQMIVRTMIPVQEYTIGQLMVAWGKPTGFSIQDMMINIYWGKRAAFVYTRSLQPDSNVVYIQYDLDEQEAESPWRGFRQRGNKG